MSFIRELKRRKVIRVGIGYLVAGWIVVQVAATVAPQLALPEWVPRLITLIVLLGLPLALVVAWVFELTEIGVRHEPAIAGNALFYSIASLIAVGSIVWYVLGAGVDTGVDEKSIAVLPFVNMSSDPENEYFSDGISEEILNALVATGEFKVVGRTSSFQFKGRNEDLRRIGELLDVAHLLEGSVRRTDERARITVQLIRAHDGYHVWSETYDRTLSDALDVQMEIAEAVGRALNVVMDDAQRERMRAAHVSDVEAFIAFQKGRELFEVGHAGGIVIETLARSADYMSEAVAHEPRFAEAYAMRADYYSHRLQLDSDEQILQETYEAYLADLDAAHTAADSPHLKAYFALERVMASHDWSNMRARWEEALATTGCGTAGWDEVGVVLGYARKIHEQAARSLECDPLSFMSYYLLAKSAIWSDEPEAALRWIDSAEARFPVPPILLQQRIDALLVLDRTADARAVQISGALRPRSEALIAAIEGNDAPARELLRELATQETASMFNSILRVIFSAAVGDRESANKTAAHIDAHPTGSMQLAWITSACLCGAPFDLAATPNFAARIQESGLPWPPAAPVKFPAKDW